MTPVVFLSYSHDSTEHKEWVRTLGLKLRLFGIDAILDQWDLKPGDDIALFVERNLLGADRVLMVCTDRYVEKANAGSGGVGYERMIATADLLKSIATSKLIPIVRQNGTLVLPNFLASKLAIDFSNDSQFSHSIDVLCRAIHGASVASKPPIGSNPYSANESFSHPIDNVLKRARTYLRGRTDKTFAADHLVSVLGPNTSELESTLQLAVDCGLLRRHSSLFWFTSEGESYARLRKL